MPLEIQNKDNLAPALQTMVIISFDVIMEEKKIGKGTEDHRRRGVLLTLWVCWHLQGPPQGKHS